MTTQPAVQVRVNRVFNASAEQVFDAWFDAESAGRWLFATPTGQMVRVEIDPRVGGSFVIVERRNGDEIEHVEISRPRQLAFNFSVPQFSKDTTRVTIDIAPQAAGCELTLTHDGVYAEYASRSVEGWTGILDGLANVV
jgi:uncharacterized protein YndB with AHSA1/START domain